MNPGSGTSDIGHHVVLCPESPMQTAKPSGDRRVARTRAALHSALMSLILRRRYEAISIQEICDTANVARSTFYDHYAGKDDLKRDGLEQMRLEIASRQADGRNARTFGFSLPMFEHGRRHLDHYRALAGSRAGALVLGKIRQIVCDLVRKDLAAGVFGYDTEREVAVQYVVGAYMAVLTWWLDGGAKQPPQDVDATFQRLITEGARMRAGECG